MVGGLQRSHADSPHTLTHGMTLAEPPCLIMRGWEEVAAWSAMTIITQPTRHAAIPCGCHVVPRDFFLRLAPTFRLTACLRCLSCPVQSLLVCAVLTTRQAIVQVYGCLCGQHHSPPLSYRWGVEPSGRDKQAPGLLPSLPLAATTMFLTRSLRAAATAATAALLAGLARAQTSTDCNPTQTSRSLAPHSSAMTSF